MSRLQDAELSSCISMARSFAREGAEERERGESAEGRGGKNVGILLLNRA